MPSEWTPSTRRRDAKRPPRELDASRIALLAHPLRARIMTVLAERPGSPKELAERFGMRLPNVSYHVRVLAEGGCIELVGTEPRRGALEHFYRPAKELRVAADDMSPAADRPDVLSVVLQRIAMGLGTAVGEGGFHSERASARWIELDLDECGSGKLSALIEEFAAQVLELRQETRARVNGSPSGSPVERARVALFRYEEPPHVPHTR